MEMTEYKIKKDGWPPGPWLEEPDHTEFHHAGLRCMTKRNSLGAWCGYVEVPPAHPLHGKHYNDVEEDLKVHGGITYSGSCDIPKTWWFGFDCAHSFDLMPGMPSDLFTEEAFKMFGSDAVYKNLFYVTEETKLLASQLALVSL